MRSASSACRRPARQESLMSRHDNGPSRGWKPFRALPRTVPGGHPSTTMADLVGQRDPSSGHLWAELGRAWRHPLRLLLDVVERAQNDDIATIAAARAYYSLFSIFPLLVFVLAVTSLLPVHGLEAWLLDNARQSLPGEAFALFERTLRGVLDTRHAKLLSLGAVLALWTSSAAFVAVTNGLNRAYRVRDPRPWWRVRLYAIGLTLVLSAFMVLAFLLTMFGGQGVELIGRHAGLVAAAVALVVRWTITVGAVVLTVTAMYYACPAIEREWRWLRPGTVLFVGGFAGTSAAFSYYVGRFGSYDTTYGSLG